MIETYSIPLAIVVGAALVAGAIFMTSSQAPAASDAATTKGVAAAVELTRTENRALYGSESAVTTIVEFSDYQCPYCARLHPTIKKIVDESEGAINWEYRHLPLPFHTSAEYAAVIAECVHKHKGNDAFWEYGDTILENQRSINEAYVRGVAMEMGLSAEQVDACETDKTIADQISNDMIAAQSYGGSGTPFSVVQFEDGRTRPVSGALPYAQWAQVLGLSS